MPFIRASSLDRLQLKIVGALLMLALSGCAHIAKPETSTSTGNGSPSAETTPGAAASGPFLKDAPATTADLNDSGSDLRAIPMGINRMVLTWIDYFQGQGRPHMERYLSRSARYMPVMKSILREKGLPEDLIYIALIESGFSSTAHSSANAVGYWQFIKGTGKQYNLRIDSFVDERRDFVKATYAAANYFRALHDMFGAWYLAIASYNVGENRVKSLTVKYRTRDFWQLARENKLPVETINYVPKFIAARLIAKEPEKYGFTDIEYMAPLDFVEVEFTTSIDIHKLAQAMNLDYDDLRDLNPAYKRGVAFEKGGKLVLRVPKGTEQTALAAALSAVPEGKQRYVADEDYSYYKVRRGETVATIAKKFGTSQRNIRTLNRLRSSSRLVAGRRIRVPGEAIGGLSRQEPKPAREEKAQKMPSSEPALSLPTQRDVPEFSRKKMRSLSTGRKVHIVRRGDTLIEIARKYEVSLRELARFNRIGRRSKVTIGTRLEIP